MGKACQPRRWVTLGVATVALVLLAALSSQAHAQQNAEPAPAGTVAPAPADPCNGAGTCYFGGSFVAEVARVTASRPSAGPVNATVVYRVEVRFRNLTNKPIILAHPADSARIVDNNGNRYWYWNAKVNVTGIGMMGNNAVDSSFVLRPNETRNATFEQRFVYDARQKIPGNTFTFDLEVDEIVPVSNQQVRIARKNAVGFRDLSARSGTTASAAAAAPAAAPAMAATSPAGAPTVAAAEPAPAGAAGPVAADPCNGASTCYFGGSFVAEVARVTASRPSAGPVNATVVYRVDVRFRNLTNKPIILAHPADSARIVDNNGNRYWYWNAKVNVTGIGMMGNNAVDSSFVVRPNETRNATFEQRFVYDARQKVPGKTFTFDLEIDELAPVSNQQMRIVRKNAVGFRDLSARGI